MKIKIIGHGTLKKYSREEYCPDPLVRIKDILKNLGINNELQDSIVSLKNGKISFLNEELQNGDVIELFILLSGG